MMIDRVKLHTFMRRLESERGPFTLFALFLRDGSWGPWDLVVSAPWLEAGGTEALGELINELRSEFTEEELEPISKIVNMDHDPPSLLRILKEVGDVSQPIQKVGRELFELPVIEAHILTARQPPIAA
jgi:hypothetical protein